MARLNVPPSTGTITESMITDLRSIALPRVQRHLFTYALRTGESDRLLGPVGDVEGEAWPNHYWYFNIPSWAQRVRVRAILGGVRVEEKAPNNYGHLYVRFGTIPIWLSTIIKRWIISTAQVVVIRQSY